MILKEFIDVVLLYHKIDNENYNYLLICHFHYFPWMFDGIFNKNPVKCIFSTLNKIFMILKKRQYKVFCVIEITKTKIYVNFNVKRIFLIRIICNLRMMRMRFQ